VKEGKNKVVSPLHAHLGYQLRLVSNAVSHAFARKLGERDVSVVEWVILREMYAFEDGTSPSVIAAKTGLTRGAISKLIDKLLDKGLVTRSESANDRRYQDIELTKSARKLLPQLASIADGNDEEFFAVLDGEERNYLMDIMVKLAGVHGLNTLAIE